MDQKIKIALTTVLAMLLLAIAAGLLTGAVYFGFFHVNGSAASRYPVRGVDVSHYQGRIDWQVLSEQDIQFAYIKATEGSSYTDERFADNWKDARQTGLRVRAYHFFSFDSSGILQAEHFIETVDAFEGMLPPVVDVEFYGNKKAAPPQAEEVASQLQAYLDRVEEAYGLKPMIYATYDTWELYIRDGFEEYPLWIRDIWHRPDKSVPWTFWQYTNRGRLQGFSGEEPYVDLNVYGGKEEWGLNCYEKIAASENSFERKK